MALSDVVNTFGQDLLRRVIQYVGHEGDAGLLLGLAVGGEQVVPGQLREREQPGPGHELLQAGGQLVRHGPDGDGAERNILHLVGPELGLHVVIAGEDLVGTVSELGHRGRHLVPVAVDPLTLLGLDDAFYVGAHKARDHERPAHADGLGVGRPKPQQSHDRKMNLMKMVRVSIAPTCLNHRSLTSSYLFLPINRLQTDMEICRTSKSTMKLAEVEGIQSRPCGNSRFTLIFVTH